LPYQSSAKTLRPQNEADRALSNPNFSGYLLLRLLLIAQFLDPMNHRLIDFRRHPFPHHVTLIPFDGGAAVEPVALVAVTMQVTSFV